MQVPMLENTVSGITLLSLLAGVLLVASQQFWKFGVKHYAGASA